MNENYNGNILEKKYDKNHYSYEWFIIYTSPLSACLAPSQASFPSGLFAPATYRFSVFQEFRTSTYPQLHLPENIFGYLTLAHPSDHNLNVRSSERPSLTDHSKLFCTLFSLIVFHSPFPEPVIMYIRIFLFFTTLSLVPIPVPIHCRYRVTSKRRGMNTH